MGRMQFNNENAGNQNPIFNIVNERNFHVMQFLDYEIQLKMIVEWK